MQPLPSQSSYFFLHPAAVTFAFNALGDPDNVGISVYSNAQVLLFVRGIDGLDQLPDNQYRSWTLSAYPTHFTDDEGRARYCHIAFSRTTNQASLCFPDTRLDLYGRAITDDGQYFLAPDGTPIATVPDDSPSGSTTVPDASQEGSTPIPDASPSGSTPDLTEHPDFYFVFIGKITASGPRNNKRPRGWDTAASYPITGTLNTATYREYEQQGDLDKMFRYSPLYGNEGAILQLLPITVSRIWKLLIGTAEKVVTNIFKLHDYTATDPTPVPDGSPSGSLITTDLDETLPTEAHMRDYTEQNYLNKNTGGTVHGPVTFKEALTIQGDTTFGTDSVIGSHGGKIWQQDGSWHAQFDFLNITKKATFTELEIQEMSHIGGAFILSAASCTIDHVEYLDASGVVFPVTFPEDFLPVSGNASIVRCYFLATDGDRHITNDWKVGDQAICKTFNLSSTSASGSSSAPVPDGSPSGTTPVANHYWWRRVLAVGTTDDAQYHYFDVSAELTGSAANNDYDPGSDLPMEGDKCMLLGHQPIDNDDRLKNIKRGNAIIIDSSGEGSPYFRSYKRIGFRSNPYSLEGCLRINLEADNPTIDVSSMTITATGKDGEEHTINVGDALEEHFNIYSLDVAADIDPDKEPGEPGYFIDPALGTDGWPEVIESWTADDYPNHVNDVAVCTNSAYFRFSSNDDGAYGWHNITDQVLIEAIRVAQEALGRLSDMADDNKITPEEKVQLKERLIEIEAEGSNLIQEASFYNISTSTFSRAYYSLLDFIRHILRDSGTTDLVDADGKYLSQSVINSIGGPVSYFYSYVTQTGGVSTFTKYMDCVQLYYTSLAALRRNITQSVRQYIDDKSFASSDQITQDIKDNVTDMWRAFSSWCNEEHGFSRSLVDLDGDVLALTKWAKNNGTYLGSGFVTEENYASLFSAAIGQDGKTIAQALANTYVSHTPDGWISGFKIEADELVIDTKNFKINRDGDVIVYGELKVKSMQQEFYDLTDLYSNDTDGFVSPGAITLDDVQQAVEGFYLCDADGNEVPTKGYYQLKVTGRDFIMSIHPRYIGRRVVLYDSNTYVKGGTATSTITIQERYNGVIQQRYFRGVGTYHQNKEYVDEHGNRFPSPSPLWHFDPISEIKFVNGIIELLGVPEEDGTCGWAVINIGTKSAMANGKFIVRE